jgi:hypothetical protein
MNSPRSGELRAGSIAQPHVGQFAVRTHVEGVVDAMM